MEVELPNGVILSDIPEGTTKAQVKAKAIAAGIATEADFGSSTSAPVPAKRSLWEEAGRQLGLTARAGVTGATDIASMVLDPAVGLVNKVVGSSLTAPSESLQQLMTKAGLPEPENKLERAVQRGASAVAGVGSQAKLAASSGVQALKPFTKEVAQQGAAAGAAGATAQVVSENMQEAGSSPTATFAATLASGLLAGGVGAKTVRSISPSTSKPVVTMEDVKLEAGRAYTRVDDAGISVKPKPLLDTVDKIETKLVSEANFNPVMEAHKPVKQVLDQFRQMIGTERVSFTKMEQLRQTAGDLVRESTDPATRRLARMVVEGVDDKITSLQPTDLITGKGNLEGALKDVKAARDAWKRTAKASMLEDALNVAEARALAPTASEGELIRTQFKQIASSKEKMRLFNQDEQAAIKRIVGGSGVETLLSMATKFNPERSQLMAGAQMAGALANPIAAGSVAAGGFTADKALGVMQNKKVQRTISDILSGSMTKPKSTTEANLRALFEARPN